MLQKFLSALADNVVILNLGLILSTILVAAIIGTIMFLTIISRPIPFYALNSINVFKVDEVNLNIQGLDNLYKENKIKCLTYTKLVIWNGGTRHIKSKDVSCLEFRTRGENVKIIAPPQVIGDSNDRDSKNKKLLAVSSNTDGSYRIQLKRLKYRQGAVIQIIHTGIDSNNIKVSGVVKKTKILKAEPLYLEKIDKKIITWLDFLDRIFLIIICLPIFYLSIVSIREKDFVVAILSIIGYVALVLLMFLSEIKEVPKSLRKYFFA